MAWRKAYQHSVQALAPAFGTLVLGVVLAWAILGGEDAAGPLLETRVVVSCVAVLLLNTALNGNMTKDTKLVQRKEYDEKVNELQEIIAQLENSILEERSMREEVEAELDRDRLFAAFRERHLKHVEHLLNNPVQGVILSIEAMSGLVQDWTLGIEESKASDSDLELDETMKLEPLSPATSLSTTQRELLMTWESRLAEFGTMTELALSAMDSLHVIVTDMYDGLACTNETLFKPIMQPTNIYSTLERVQFALRYHSAYGDVNVVSQQDNLGGGLVPEFHVADNLSTCVTDPRWFISAALKLIGNARRFSGPGDEVQVHLSLKRLSGLEGAQSNDVLLFEVRDSGKGVKPEFRDLLYTVDVKRSDYHGFGLYMVAAKVHALGGQCGYKPNEETGRGSIFWFEIPYKVTECKATSRAGPQYLRNTLQRRRRGRLPTTDVLPLFNKSREETSAPNIELKRVLIIEDEEVQQKLLTKQLENLSYEVFVAKDGVEGLEALKQRPYTVVLCDKLMPRMNGDVCIRQFRRWESANRPGGRQFICGLSATKESALPEGFDLYLPKPIRRNDIVKLLRQGET